MNKFYYLWCCAHSRDAGRHKQLQKITTRNENVDYGLNPERRCCRNISLHSCARRSVFNGTNSSRKYMHNTFAHRVTCIVSNEICWATLVRRLLCSKQHMYHICYCGNVWFDTTLGWVLPAVFFFHVHVHCTVHKHQTSSSENCKLLAWESTHKCWLLINERLE